MSTSTRRTADRNRQPDDRLREPLPESPAPGGFLPASGLLTGDGVPGPSGLGHHPSDALPGGTVAADGAAGTTDTEGPETADTETGPTTVGRVLTVGAADDPHEAAADRAADAALRRIGPPLLSRTSAGASAGTSAGTSVGTSAGTSVGTSAGTSVGTSVGEIRRSASAMNTLVGQAGGELDPAASAAIDSARGSGRALPNPVRQRMETAFGTGFGAVRIHDDNRAADMSGSISALAFTTGKDIFFGKGQFAPETPEGEHMLAHELAHTLQQHDTIGRIDFPNPFAKTPAEKEAQQKKDQEKARLKKEAAAAKVLAEIVKKKAAEDKKAEEAAKKKAADEKKKLESAHKAMEKSEKKKLADERKTNTSTRKGFGDLVNADQQGGAVTSATMNELNKKMVQLVDRETQVREQMITTGIDPDEAADAAYEQVWTVEAGPEMQAFKPARATAAEKLTSAVRAQRLEDTSALSAEEQQRADAKHGTMLSKEVEKTYDAFVLKIAHWLEGGYGLTVDEATSLAEKEIWGAASDKARKLRPTDPAVEQVAIADARKRTSVSVTPAASASGLDTAIEGMGTVNSYVAPALGPTLGVLTSSVKSQGKADDKALAIEAGMAPTEAFTPGTLPVIGELAGAIKASENRVAKGQATDASIPLKPMSVNSQASLGIGAATGVLTSLTSAVANVLKLAKAVQQAQEHGDTAGRLMATKAAADAAASVVSIGKSSATLAKVIDPGVTNSVATVIPGLNIFVSVMGIVGGAMSTAEAGLRLSDANASLTDARTRDPKAAKADVLVQPLLHIASACTKQLEQAIWNTAVSVSDFATSVATVASGGGFGIPAAVQAGVKLIDLLHTAGHFVADQVLAKLSQDSRVDAMLALEGAAENQLRYDPAMAVDGIILKARKGDAIAVSLLTSYRVTEDEIKTGRLPEVRSKVLSRIGEDADPKLVYQKLADKLKPLKAMLTDDSPGKLDTIAQMGADRTALDGKKRGFAWKVTMLLKNEEKFGRSVRKTNARAGRPDKPVAPTPEVADNSTMGMSLQEFHQQVACYVGKARLLVTATPQQVEVFLRIVQGMDDATIQQAISNPNNSAEWQQALVELLAERAAAGARV